MAVRAAGAARVTQGPQPIERLDEAAIRQALPQWPAGRLRRLEVLEEVDSTSNRLLAVTDLPAGRFDACLAEYQTAGRGRRGRRWLAPFGSGLCLSVNWNYRESPATLGALSLAAGVALLRALSRVSCPGLSLKWPNDILHGSAKLGGVLIDLRGEPPGPAYVVTGVGINVRLPETVRAALSAHGLRATDLAAVCGPPSRNALAAALIAELAQMFEEFGARGLAAFVDEWRAADAFANRRVRVQSGEQVLEGCARGVDDDGALLLETAGGQRRVLSGEVSVRTA
ncbi:MAG: biotin--[acetyl-CoA-carboxylase] ligase [Gammaproteobacteria bacterium]